MRTFVSSVYSKFEGCEQQAVAEGKLYVGHGRVEWDGWRYRGRFDGQAEASLDFATDIEPNILPGPYHLSALGPTIIRAEPASSGEEHLAAYKQALMACFRITEHDISANHDGQLGPGQKRIVMGQGIKRTALGCATALVGFGLFLHALFSGIDSLWDWVYVTLLWLGAFGFGGIYLIASGIRNSFEGQIEVLEGNVVSHTQMKKDGWTYDLAVGGATLEAGHLNRCRAFQCLRSGDEHRVYVTRRGRTVVWIEPRGIVTPIELPL